MCARARNAQRELAGWDEGSIDSLLLELASKVARAGAILGGLHRTLHEDRNCPTKRTSIRHQHGSSQRRSLAELARAFWGSNGADAFRLQDSRHSGVFEIASPVGVVFGLVPVTSPVATAIFKMIIALKGRNALILNPNRIALPVCRELAALTDDLLARQGAPAHAVQWITQRNSRRKTQLFMRHKGVDLILATGGSAMVEAAYSSGTPALGRPGNAPVLVAEDADVEVCAYNVIRSKSFDNGLICGAENNAVVVRARLMISPSCRLRTKWRSRIELG